MAVLRSGRRLTGAERDAAAAWLAREYTKDKSIRDLAEESGRSYGCVNRFLTEAGAIHSDHSKLLKPRELPIPRAA
ncbi:helix-turn-helix domain-containing protein [Streptomyces sp. NPDC056549]|uniref:helix-turn-helix domain-containing protein n=1 Tax=Streptomyces sp. NPDC056549 TaxID=3345864 RepID=UPI00367E2F26